MTTIVKISLNAEGVLLKCTLGFVASPKIINHPNKHKYVSWVVPKVNKNDILLYLGCWHYKPASLLMTPRPYILNESKSTNWITYLKFLNNQTIVKVEWVGVGKTEQLYEAAKFLYSHFQLMDGEGM